MDKGFCEIFRGRSEGRVGKTEARENPSGGEMRWWICSGRAGSSRIGWQAFVSPKWVPQNAGSGQVLGGIRRAEGVPPYAALTPNMRGYEDAVAAKAVRIAVFRQLPSEGVQPEEYQRQHRKAFAAFRPPRAKRRHVDIPVRGYVLACGNAPLTGRLIVSKVAVADRFCFSDGLL